MLLDSHTRSIKEFYLLIRSDLYRITGNTKFTSFLYQITLGESFKYIFWMRVCCYLSQFLATRFTLFIFARLILSHYSYKLGISIPYQTKIGSGFYIGHFGGIVVNGRAIIGKNCNLSHCVTIGQANRGKIKGSPIIGDNVYIGPGAKIIGSVNVGNNVAIGANCVVTKDVPENAVAVGVPNRVVSFQGSYDYVSRIDY